MSKIELISMMCEREINRLMAEGRYGLAYGEAIKGRRRGANIPEHLISELVSMVE